MKWGIICAGLLAVIGVCRQSLIAHTQVDATSRYQEIAIKLGQMIQREMVIQALPAVSIVLVDDQQVVWAHGFGFADPKTKAPASAETIYRVGPVSELFTVIALMQLVEKGELDLDAPVIKHLPDFHPENKFGKPITLRELMSHRSGLVREPPASNDFDSSEPSLEATVARLNATALIYSPGTHVKYSNAAMAVAEYVLQKQAGVPFASYLETSVLKPLGMTGSAFSLTPEMQNTLAKSFIGTYDRRVLDVPTSRFGVERAECMYASVLDLAKFISMLFADGQGTGGRVVKPETLRAMWQPQISNGTQTTGFGIGFQLANLDGHRMVGDGGTIHGFSTDLEALPEDKLGVVVVTTMDSANGSLTKIANQSLRLMLAVKTGGQLPVVAETSEVPLQLARAAAARYESGGKGLNLIEESGKLSVLPADGGDKIALRQMGESLIEDDRLAYGRALEVFADAIKVNGEVLQRKPDSEPKAAPHAWEGLIGEYGGDYNTLYILENSGKLTSLIDWHEYEPLEQASANVYRYPAQGLYDGETLTFERDANGKATEVKVGGVVLKRRAVGPADGKIFRIKPVKPVDELRKAALREQPPQEAGNFKKPDLVELTTLDRTIKLDIRYATTNDFLSTPMYQQARAFMQRPAAEAAMRANQELRKKGYGLLIHDAYRPWYVTKMFWDGTPESGHIFVADPSQGSRHNRGCAVDLTMYELATGRPVEMVGVYDEMSPRSYPYYPGGTSKQRWLRTVLRHAMEEQGFSVYETEWWHFDFGDWQSYPILNQTFEQLDGQATRH